MMDTPGTVLKSERERQEKSLKDVARKLKINIKYLEAIEDDDFAVLPADVFARSYIRLYADELDLDSSKLLALFENMGNVPADEEPIPMEEAAPVPPPSGEGQKRSFKPLLIIAAAGLLIVVLIFTLQKGERGGEESAPAARQASVHERKEPVEKERPPVEALPAEKRDRAEDTVPAVKPGPAPVHIEEKRAETSVAPPQNKKPAAEKSPVPVEKAEVVQPAPAPQSEMTAPVQPAVRDEQKPVAKAAGPGMVYEKTAGEMTLKIVATELTWVSLSIDGASPREWHLRPGQIITLKGQTVFKGKIGNAGGTKLYLNNRDLGELGPSGAIVDITLPQ
jgi:cytoskeleton protein RodZ